MIGNEGKREDLCSVNDIDSDEEGEEIVVGARIPEAPDGWIPPATHEGFEGYLPKHDVPLTFHEVNNTVTCCPALRTVPVRHPIHSYPAGSLTNHSLAQRTINTEESGSIGSVEDNTEDFAHRGVPKRAGAKTAKAHSVEENGSVLPSLLSPPELKELKQKRSRKWKTQGIRTTHTKA